MNERMSREKAHKRRWLFIIFMLLVPVGILMFLIAIVDFGQMWRIYTFFDENERIENFRNCGEIFPVRRIRCPAQKYAFAQNIRPLSGTYEFKGKTAEIDEFLEETITTGLLVVKDDKIVTERYYHESGEDTLFTSMSVVKSFVSALVGIAIDEGLISGVDRPISDYVPGLRGSGYDGVPIKHVLQMSSGVKFDEVYEDLFSDINLLFYKVFALNQPINDYMVNLKREHPSGTTSYYRSCDTQALGMLISAVSGKPVSAYLEEKIWTKIGMEYDATWCTDTHDTEIAFGFLNAALRDYAKFGMLYLHNGNWGGQQVVSADWVHESVTPDNPNLQPGPKPEEYWTFGNFGYQYQWWIPENPDGEYLAIGVWGQYIYVYPKENLVVVKTSVDPHFADNDFEHDDETVEVFRAIAACLRDKGEETPTGAKPEE